MTTNELAQDDAAEAWWAERDAAAVPEMMQMGPEAGAPALEGELPF